MAICWSLIIVASAASAFAQPATQPAGVDASPCLLVFSRSLSGTSCGNAFAIGDGSLVVTARHVVFPQQLLGQHQGDVFVTVFSPYLGEACEADLIAQDRELDLAILHCPWKGHPALQLAEDVDVIAQASVTLAGYTDVVGAISAAQPRLLARLPPARVSQLVIDSVTVRRGATRTIVTEKSPAGGGWSGAAMLVPGRLEAAGVYCRTQANGAAGVGAASGPIRALIQQSNAATSLASSPQSQLALPDAAQAAALFSQAIAASAAHDPQSSAQFLESYIKIRASSAVAWRDLAGQMRALNRLDDAQNDYAKALELDPSLISARVLYGQLLAERTMPDHAMEQLRYAWEHGRGSTAAVIPMCNLLRRQGKDAECLSILEKAVAQNPNDSFLWTYLAQTRAGLKDTKGAAEAFARAADLMPENEPLRADAARAFASAGERQRAEEQFRRLLDHDPLSSGGHFFFAQFLAEDASRRADALREAQTALENADRPGAPPRDRIQALIDAIRSAKPTKDEFKL